LQGPRTTFIYLAVVFGLLVIPRALQRFRLPAQLTCFAFGIIVAGFFKPLATDGVVSSLATSGLHRYFSLPAWKSIWPSFAGSCHRWRDTSRCGGWCWWLARALAAVFLHLGWQVDCLLALALLTPSTGFILDMLPHSGLDHTEQSEVALHAVAGEVTAVFLFLVISQADSVKTLLISGGAIALLIAFMPLVFLALGRFVVPYAPGSEFSLLVMMGLICAVITETLGVYYLVGAFVAGQVARSLRKRMRTLASEQNLEAISLFASFFVPFYFFTMDSECPAPRWSLTLSGTGLR
jgi:Kef-type K+ transport system membrane component KefB